MDQPYIAVTLKQPRKYRFWLGRKTLDGSIALIAEFANEHTLNVVVKKLNDEPIPTLRMDPEQPDKIDFHHPSVVTGEAFRSHPDSIRAHNQRWPDHQRNPEDGRPIRKPDRDAQPAGVPADAAGVAGAQPENATAGDKADASGH